MSLEVTIFTYYELTNQMCDVLKKINRQTFIATLLQIEEGNYFPEKVLLVFSVSVAPPS